MLHILTALYHLSYGALIGLCLWATFYLRLKHRGFK